MIQQKAETIGFQIQKPIRVDGQKARPPLDDMKPELRHGLSWIVVQIAGV